MNERNWRLRNLRHGGRVKYASLLFAVSIVAACQTTPDYRDNRSQLETRFDTCSATNDYDRKSAKSLKDYQLGRNEIAWRQCAYAAIETQMIPSTPIPDLYRQIIAEDKQMTADIQQRRMTRAARRARLDTLIAEIEKREKAHQKIREKEQESNRRSQIEQQKIDDIIAIQQQTIRARIIVLQGIR